MIKYRCPSCGAHCSTSYCNDCGKDIPMSYRFNDETQSDPDDRLPFYARINGDTNTSSMRPSSYSSNISFDKKIGDYISIDSRNKVLKVQGENDRHTFADLLNYELYENNSVVMKGGVGRAIVGGALFGEVGAVVGASTRKSQNVVDALYIRLTFKSSGMRKITFICNATDRNGMAYRGLRQFADQVVSELEIIMAENQSAVTQTVSQPQYEPQPAPPPVQQPAQTEQSPTLIADELLKLKQLLDMGVLTEEEFNQQKQKLLNS